MLGATMSHPDSLQTTNILVNALAEDDRALLRPHLSRVPLPRGHVLVAANAPIEHVYFPEGGVVSIVSIMQQGGRIEAGIFGREGVSATCLLLGTDTTPHECFVQVNGSTALRIDADRYLAAVQQSEALRAVLLRYVQTVLVQTAQSMATAAAQRVEVRLARWLLMCNDRVEGDEIALTHEFMGMMIAAERSGVTVTLHILEGAGMIRSLRGRVIIRDRDKLEDLAGDSYGVPEAEYRRLIGPFARRSVVLQFDSHGGRPS
jgi:CRP-like cAMP-binding protein